MRAFVLGGGGARGALQVGALRALLEAGIEPELLVGTSIGAANAAFLAIRGTAAEALSDLEDAWRVAAGADLLPANYVWLTVRALFNRPGFDGGQRIRDYFVGQGLEPSLRFRDLDGPSLVIVAADLKAGSTVLYGLDPEERVLDAVLASTAIPPWVRPVAQGSRRLMDGGTVSNLPVEPAISQGATEIVALDLADARPVLPDVRGFGSFLHGLIHTVEQRQVYLELRLAEACRVPVHHIRLVPDRPVAVWEFGRSLELIEPGYRVTRQYLADHPELRKRSRWSRRPRPSRRKP